jgi:hypothetical protein
MNGLEDMSHRLMGGSRSIDVNFFPPDDPANGLYRPSVASPTAFHRFRAGML